MSPDLTPIFSAKTFTSVKAERAVEAAKSRKRAWLRNTRLACLLRRAFLENEVLNSVVPTERVLWRWVVAVCCGIGIVVLLEALGRDQTAWFAGLDALLGAGLALLVALAAHWQRSLYPRHVWPVFVAIPVVTAALAVLFLTLYRSFETGVVFGIGSLALVSLLLRGAREEWQHARARLEVEALGKVVDVLEKKSEWPEEPSLPPTPRRRRGVGE